MPSCLQDALAAALDRADQARTAMAARLADDPALAAAYGELLNRARDLSLADPRRGTPKPKDFLKAVRSAGPEARLALALRGAREGAAKAVMNHLASLDVSPDERLLAGLSCALEAADKTLEFLDAAQLASDEHRILVVLAALRQQPVLDYEEYRSLESHYQGLDSGQARDAFQVQRRFEQARARRSQHARGHLLGQVPAGLKQQPEAYAAILEACFKRDPFGTLEHLRESGGADPCAGLPWERRLDLLDGIAERGLGLASTYLDLFAIPGDPAWTRRLQRILQRDMTAGGSLFGAYALEGVQNYPFGLGRIELALPRRVSSAEALVRFKQGEDATEKPRTPTAIEVADLTAHLQDQEVSRFLVGLKSDIARQWQACVQDRKREIVFGDPGLKIRNVLFLLGQALFEPEETFDQVFRNVQQSHPMFASDGPRILLLANRFYFLDVLGLNPGLLFSRNVRPGGGARTLIQDAGDYPVRCLLQAGMSIHLRIGDALFRLAPIAWNILLGQCEGRIDAAIQEIANLFDGFDTLLTIASPVVPDLEDWVSHLVGAIVEDASEVPWEGSWEAFPMVLRLTTLKALERYREAIGRYCLQGLRRSAQVAGVSPVNIIQGLHLPRSKTDRLRALLDQGRKG
ncbi:MAG: hypothetical protein P4L36_20890 [Holophaga sp.]|nr:hypothetical protein [Holophaga sp.]